MYYKAYGIIFVRRDEVCRRCTVGNENGMEREKIMAQTAVEPEQKKTRLMTEGSIWKNILLFSVPLILGNLLQQLYNCLLYTSDAADE